MLSRSKKLDFIILVIAGLFFGGGYLWVKYVESDQIKKDFSMTTGRIYELANEDPGMRNAKTYTRYKYFVNGKEYERGSYDMEPCEGFEKHIDEIKGFRYPIIYNNEDPEKSRILVSPKHFEEYGVAFHEEIRSIYEKYWSCK